MMTNAAANLPGNKRVLIRWIVADQEHSFGFVKLIQGQQGVGGAIAESREQSRVIGSAVMIDVVGAKGDARKALQKIVFLVRCAVRTDEANGIPAARAVNLLQLGSGGLRSFFPGYGIQLVAFSEERLANWPRGVWGNDTQHPPYP